MDATIVQRFSIDSGFSRQLSKKGLSCRVKTGIGVIIILILIGVGVAVAKLMGDDSSNNSSTRALPVSTTTAPAG